MNFNFQQSFFTRVISQVSRTREEGVRVVFKPCSPYLHEDHIFFSKDLIAHFIVIKTSSKVPPFDLPVSIYVKGTDFIRSFFRFIRLQDKSIIIELSEKGCVRPDEHIVISIDELKSYPELSFLLERKIKDVEKCKW